MRLAIVIAIFTNWLYATNINVAIAANLSYIFPKLIAKFNQNYPNIHITTVISSSGKLASQIIHNAPFDIFLSANEKYPHKLYQLSLTKTKPIIYARGILVLFSTKYYIASIQDLNQTKYNKIAIANKHTAPYGIATDEVLKKLNLYKKLKSKFIYGQSVGQTLTFALNGADAGFVAKSYFYSPKLQKYHFIQIDPTLYTPIKQSMVLLSDSKDAKLFFDFLQSNKAQTIFKQFGYN